MAVNIGSLFGEVVIDTRKMEKGLKRARRNLAAFGRSTSGTGKALARGVVAPVAALGITAAKTFAGFEQEMQKVKAVANASETDFQALEQSAMDLGASTRFAASEVAGLQLNLAKLGFSPREINQSTESILNLALAAGEDLAESARVAASTLKAFNLQAVEMSRVTDVMAKSFSSSALDLEKFSVAMPKMGKAAEAAGFSLEQATAMLGILVDNGIEASTAGTNLRNIFISMAEQGITLSQAIDSVNSSQNALVEGTELFDKRTAVAILTLAQSTAQMEELVKTLDLAEGSAADMAKIMDDSVVGAFFRLRSVVESVQIELMKANGRDTGLQAMIDNFAKLISKNKDLIIEKSELVLKLGLFSAALSGSLLLAGQLAFALKNLAGAAIFLNRVVVGSLVVGLMRLRKTLLALVVTIGIMTGVGGTLALLKTGLAAIVAVLASIKVGKLIDLGTEAETASNKIKLASNEIKLLRENFETYEEALSSLGDESVFAEESIEALKKAFEETGANALITAEQIKNIATEMANMSEEQLAAELAKIMKETADSSGKFLSNVTQTVDEMESLAEKAAEARRILNSMSGKGERDEMGELLDKMDRFDKKVTRQRKQVADLFADMNKMSESLDLTFDDVLKAMDEHGDKKPKSMSDAIKQFGEDAKSSGDLALHAMEQASDGMTNAMMNFFETGRSGLRAFAADFLKTMARLTLQQNVINPLVAGLTGLITGNPVAAQAPTKKATGGSVFANRPYLVGEKGAELFVPGMNGAIVPNHAMAGNTPVNVTFNVQATDAQSFDNQLAQREQMFIGMIDKAFNKRGRSGING